MALSEDKKGYSLELNFGDYHLTNSKPSCLKTQLEFTLGRISGAFNALF
jgi:hypothetical protein